MVNMSKIRTLSVLHILNDGFVVSLPLLLPFIKDDLQLNLTQVGFLSSSLHMLGIVLAIPAGIIASKWGGLRSLTWAVMLYGLGFIATSLAPNYWLVIVAFLLAGIGFGVFHPIAFATVAAWTTKSDRGRAMGNFTAIGDLGRIGISAGITALAAYLGWRLTSGLYGAVALGLFVIFWLFFQKESVIPETKKTAPLSFRYFLKHKRFMLATLTGALDSFASSSLFVFIPFLLLSKGMSPATLGIFTGFYFVGNFMGKTVLGRFVDWFGNIKVFIAAELLMAINIVLFALSQNWLLVSIIAIVLGALTKGTVPVIQTMVAEATEQERSFEHVFALNALLVSVATVIAPLLFGIVADKQGIEAVFLLSAGFALMAIVTALSLRSVNHRIDSVY